MTVTFLDGHAASAARSDIVGRGFSPDFVTVGGVLADGAIQSVAQAGQQAFCAARCFYQISTVAHRATVRNFPGEEQCDNR